MYGVECGRHCVVHGKLYVHLFPSAKVKIGDNLYFSSGWGINALCANKRGMIYATHDACISIGDNVGMSSTVLWSHKKITIGNHVKIGGNCIRKHSKKCTFYTLRFGCSFAAVNTIKPQLL